MGERTRLIPSASLQLTVIEAAGEYWLAAPFPLFLSLARNE
jgi:hypothetical protein